MIKNGLPMLMRLEIATTPRAGEPGWLIPESIEYSRVQSACVTVTVNAAVGTDRAMQLNQYNTNGDLVASYQTSAVVTSDDSTVIVTWHDSGDAFTGPVGDYSATGRTSPLGELVVAGGDSFEVIGHNTGANSDVLSGGVMTILPMS